MAWDKQHKANTKERILASAAELFTRYGFEQVSINQVMANARLTRGAFYAHFSSKSELHAQALLKAARQARTQQIELSESCLPSLAKSYLSQAHRDQELQHLCPLAFLVSDINQQDATVKNTYTQVFKGFVENAQTLTDNKRVALQTSVLMIGGLALAKALNDTTLSDNLLNACQQAIATLNEANPL